MISGISIQKLNTTKIKASLFLLLIIFIGLLARLKGLNKESGLWYDEMLCYDIARQAFPFEIIGRLLNGEYHLPLYYFYLHFWMNIFGESDISLRLSSVLPGILLIPVMFFLGKELKSLGLGFLAASVTALSPFLIYYSQEVRFYSLLTLFSALSSLFMLKLLRNPESLPNSIGFIFSGICVLYTFSFGIIYISIKGFILLLYNIFAAKSKRLYFIIGILCVLAIPAALLNYYNWIGNQNSFIELFFWSKLNAFTPLFLLNDWFTNYLTGLFNHKPDYYLHVLTRGPIIAPLVYSFVLFSAFPFVIGFVKALSDKKKLVFYISIPVISMLLMIIFLASKASFIALSRYTLIFFPLLLIICLYGIMSFNNKAIKMGLISAILFFFCINLINPYNISNSGRFEGLNYLASGIKSYNFGTKDYLINITGGKFLEKYYKDCNVFDFDVYKMLLLDKKRSELKKIFDNEFIDSISKNNALVKLYPYLVAEKPPEKFEKYISNNFLAKIDKNRYFILVTRIDADMSENKLKFALRNPAYFFSNNNDSLFALLSSKIVMDIKKIAEKSMKYVSKEQKKQFVIYVFKK